MGIRESYLDKHRPALEPTAELLLVCDDPDGAVRLHRILSPLYRVATVTFADMASLSGKNEYAVVLIVSDVPSRNHPLQWICAIRSYCTAPIVALVRGGFENLVTTLLRAGAAEIVPVDVDGRELLARIRAVTRRAAMDFVADPARPDMAADEYLVAGNLMIHLAARKVSVGGQEMRLSRREYELLCALARRRGRIVDRATLQQDIWGSEITRSRSVRNVDVYINKLRQRFGETAADPKYIHTVRAKGVRLAHVRANRR